MKRSWGDKMNRRTAFALLILVIASFAIKLYPPLTNNFLVNFDSIYHARIGQMVADTGWVPSFDYAAGGRPHLYPPLYHLLLGYSSIVSGIPVIELIKFMLPFISALLVLPTFYLIGKFRDEETALLGAAFMAFNPIIAAQSYDSPQLFGLLLFPVIVRFFIRGDYIICGGLLAVSALFNYFVTSTIAAIMIAFGIIKWLAGRKTLETYGKEKKYLIYAGLAIVIALGLASPWLLVSISRAGNCFDLSTAVSSMASAGMGYLLIMVPFVAILGFIFLYGTRNSRDDYALIWRTALGLSVVGFFLSLVMPQFHPYDQLLMAGFSLAFILPELKMRESNNMALIALGILASLLMVSAIKPALSNGDLAAVYWIKENAEGGTVLANPEISAAINTITMSISIKTEFDLFLECLPDSKRWSDMYEALKTSDSAKALQILQQYGVDYVIIGDRDIWNYKFDTAKFSGMGLEIVFSSNGTKIYRIK